MRHLSGITLERYSLEQLSDTTIELVVEHLLICQTCRDRLDRFEECLSSIKRASEKGVPLENDVPLTLKLLSLTMAIGGRSLWSL
jgi:hypothetical protein